MDKQNVRILRANSADDSSNDHVSKADNVIFVAKKDVETVAAFKRSATVET